MLVDYIFGAIDFIKYIKNGIEQESQYMPSGKKVKPKEERAEVISIQCGSFRWHRDGIYENNTSVRESDDNTNNDAAVIGFMVGVIAARQEMINNIQRNTCKVISTKDEIV